jgi:hypothetical protein
MRVFTIWLSLTVSIVSSQLYEWAGSFNYLYAFSDDANVTDLTTCCVPSSPLNITQYSNTIAYTLNVPQVSCANLSLAGYTQPNLTVSNGYFFDATNGIFGFFYPNNYSMTIFSTYSNCAWVFGSTNTINTNSTVSNITGLWVSTQTIQYDMTLTSCCVLSSNVTISPSASNTTFQLGLTFNESTACANFNVSGKTVSLTENFMGGGFIDSINGSTGGTIQGFYYPQSSTLEILFGGCGSYFYNYNWTYAAQTLNTTNMTLVKQVLNLASTHLTLSIALYLAIVTICSFVLF